MEIIIALATVVYTVFTGALWWLTNRNIKDNQKFYQFTFLTHLSDAFKNDQEKKEIIDTVTISFFKEEFGELYNNLQSIPMTTPQELVNLLKGVISFEKDIEELLEQGKIADAEKLAQSRLKDHPNNNKLLEAYIGVLLAFNDKEKAEIAWGALSNSSINNVEIYSNLGYTFWEFGDFKTAIEVEEQCLEIINDSNVNPEHVGQLKNSLAYFYAETGDQKYDTSARDLTNEACEIKPDSYNWMDTKGYIKIVYGKSDEEILEGMDLCFKAFSGDTSLRKLYEKHSKKAMDRLDKKNK